MRRCVGRRWLQPSVGWIVLLLCLLVGLVDVEMDPFVMTLRLRKCMCWGRKDGWRGAGMRDTGVRVITRVEIR